MDEIRYTVKIRPARFGFKSSVSKETKIWENDGDGDAWPEWMSWYPEAEFWRPTEKLAIRRAERKRKRLMGADVRYKSVRTVE